MRVSPKHYFADPSIVVALLGMSPARLLQDWQTFGMVFENLVMRDLQVYAGAHALASTHPVRYYRDDSGLEADWSLAMVLAQCAVRLPLALCRPQDLDEFLFCTR